MADPDNQVIEIKVKLKNVSKDPGLVRENIEAALKGQSFEAGETIEIQDLVIVDDAA